MPSERTCNQCGAPLPDNAPGNRCPKCLLQFALDDSCRTAALPESGVLIEQTGTMIGRYKLLQQIGEGGFGVVFSAEQTEPVQRKVALKVIKAGMDIVAGHHPHVLQAVETYHGGVIAYSLGHFYMPPFRLSLNRTLQNTAAVNDGPLFYPRPASREFVLLRVELPGEFTRSPGAVNVVAGGLDESFRLRPYSRVALKDFSLRLENLGCPLRNRGYSGFWRHYRAWRKRELAAWRQWPSAEELQPQTLPKVKS